MMSLRLILIINTNEGSSNLHTVKFIHNYCIWIQRHTPAKCIHTWWRAGREEVKVVVPTFWELTNTESVWESLPWENPLRLLFSSGSMADRGLAGRLTIFTIGLFLRQCKKTFVWYLIATCKYNHYFNLNPANIVFALKLTGEIERFISQKMQTG